MIDTSALAAILLDERRRTRWVWRSTILWKPSATFGKGRHVARLNFGDCFAYALAQSSGEPLLFKGNDFTRTAVRAVPWST